MLVKALDCGVNADDALRQANQKFLRRFTYIEQQLAPKGLKPCPENRDEMWKLWGKAKKLEKANALGS